MHLLKRDTYNIKTKNTCKFSEVESPRICYLIENQSDESQLSQVRELSLHCCSICHERVNEMCVNSNKWYVLNYIAPQRPRREGVESVVDKFATANSVHLEVFAPTFVEMIHREGQIKLVERPLLFHYVFVNGNIDAVKSLCNIVSGFSLVVNPNSDNRYLTVPDAHMQSFRTIARFHGNKLPCFAINEIELEKGDLVEIVSGKFAGLIGTYISRRGSSKGNIVVSVTQNLAAVIYDIEVEYVRVLQFAKDSKRAYDQVDAYVPRLFAALRYYYHDKEIPRRILTPLIVFNRRFEVVSLNNAKLDAKVQLLLMTTAKVLGNTNAYEESRIRFNRLSKSITNNNTRALVNLLTGIINKDRNILNEGINLMPSDECTKTKYTRQLREEYDSYLSE